MSTLKENSTAYQSIPHIRTEPSKGHYSSLSETKGKQFWAADQSMYPNETFVRPFDLTATHSLTPLKRPLGERYAITPQAQDQNRYASTVLEKLTTLEKS